MWFRRPVTIRRSRYHDGSNVNSESLMKQLPVLLIVFNRPVPTREVILSLRALRPSRLYIAADGPRPGCPDDIQNCAKVRQLADLVDWPCRLETLFQKQNLGCGPAVSQAIDWFFSHEMCGAILEDDCLPHPDFLAYCSWALEKYRDERCVYHVGGNNFGAAAHVFAGASIGFTSLAQVWVWATWRDRWAAYQYDPATLLEATGESWRDWRLPTEAAKLKLADLERTVRLQQMWDYQWQVTVLNRQGLAVVPSGNLISNIGDGEDATHTPGDSRCWLPTTEEGFERTRWDEKAPEPVEINERLQSHFIEIMHLTPHPAESSSGFIKRLKQLTKRIFRPA